MPPGLGHKDRRGNPPVFFFCDPVRKEAPMPARTWGSRCRGRTDLKKDADESPIRSGRQPEVERRKAPPASPHGDVLGKSKQQCPTIKIFP